jgi:DNA-binding response OmpR family regulator
MLLENEPTISAALKTAVNASGHRVQIVTSSEQARAAFRKQRVDVLLISESACSTLATQLALEAERRGIRCMIMTKSLKRLQEIRATGLISFHASDVIADLQAAVCTRL